MKTSCFVQTLGVLALLSLSSQSFAQTTAASDPVGFVTVNVPANSDAVISVPLNRAAVFKGVIQSISGSTITVAGTSPAWTGNQFVQALPSQVNTYAVQIASGAKEGMIGKVTANSANSVTIQLAAGDDLTAVKTEAVDGTGMGDHIDIFPYWSPTSLLGNALPSGTLLIGFSASGTGINLGATDLYGATGSGWEDGNTGDPADHIPLPFGAAYVCRNGSANALALSVAGSVPMTKFRTRLAAGSTSQDIYFGYSSPVPEAVISLGIPAIAGDQIIGFDNSATGINKGATIIYGYTGSGWEDGNTGDPLDVNTKLQPGFGYIYRRNSTGSPNSVVWSHLPSYLQ